MNSETRSISFNQVDPSEHVCGSSGLPRRGSYRGMVDCRNIDIC